MDYQKVGERIRRERRSQELTQANVAMLAGISEKYYANIERGANKGRLEIYYNISRALGVTLDQLVTDAPAPRAETEEESRPAMRIDSAPVVFLMKDCIVIPPDKSGND